ncbi:hypothetical protein CHARACLAT_031686 [Characodon lateralis]|uniref:Uncharacterized protein n=1 Tax=Characodon lateralis TaxID=208331 RepID=A0ABU7E562_9TELE|nr:hypothetical protein [Characodon lateralis]
MMDVVGKPPGGEGVGLEKQRGTIEYFRLFEPDINLVLRAGFQLRLRIPAGWWTPVKTVRTAGFITDTFRD